MRFLSIDIWIEICIITCAEEMSRFWRLPTSWFVATTTKTLSEAFWPAAYKLAIDLLNSFLASAKASDFSLWLGYWFQWNCNKQFAIRGQLRRGSINKSQRLQELLIGSKQSWIQELSFIRILIFLYPPQRGYIRFVNTFVTPRNNDLRPYVLWRHLISKKF